MSLNLRICRALRLIFLGLASLSTLSASIHIVARDPLYLIADLLMTLCLLVGWIVVYLVGREISGEEETRRAEETIDRLVREELDLPWMEHRSPQGAR